MRQPENGFIHFQAAFKCMAEKEKHIVLPLPPYSPELNPIEKVWANIKRALRKIASGHSCLLEMLLGVSYFV